MPEQKQPAGAQALEDDALDRIAGGYEVVFQNEEVNRDSWFVSLMTRRMIQDQLDRELGSGRMTFPATLEVQGRSYRVTAVGDTYYIREILS